MQIGAKDIENLLDCGVEFFFEKTYFHSSLHGNR